MYTFVVFGNQEETMLVLSRRVGEAVCVGPGVTVRVMEANSGRVRLAIDAPREVRILRSELEPIAARPAKPCAAEHS